MLDAELITEPEAAEFLRMSPGGLANARRDQRGPPFIKIGRMVRYRTKDLLRYVDEHARQPNAG